MDKFFVLLILSSVVLFCVDVEVLGQKQNRNKDRHDRHRGQEPEEELEHRQEDERRQPQERPQDKMPRKPQKEETQEDDWPVDDDWNAEPLTTTNTNSCNFTSSPKECDPAAHHLHCHDPELDQIHLCVGESIAMPNKCMQMSCIHYDGNVILLRGCPNIVAGEGCYLTEPDNTQLFPDCCPKEVCYESKK